MCFITKCYTYERDESNVKNSAVHILKQVYIIASGNYILWDWVFTESEMLRLAISVNY